MVLRTGVATFWTAALCLQPSLSAGKGTAVYELRDSYMPQGFFSKWDFWTDADPSNGAVQYLSREAAAAAGMLKEEADHAYFGVDMARQVEQGAGRPSVRIQSKASYNSGLFVARINHAPTGCGTWPAFWLYGEDPLHPWPTWGEYDVAESINNMKRGMTTLHTSERCTQEGVTAGSDFLSEWEKGTNNRDAADNCDVKTPGQWENQGCSQKGPMNSWGQPFNAQGGGTYAAEWDPEAEHIRTWFWPAGMEPSDISSRLPMPDTWGTPFSYFSLKKGTCDSNHFKNMRLVFTLNMCGDLADPYFGDACPALAKQMSCQELAEQHPELLSEAYWSVASLDVYQKPQGHGRRGHQRHAPRGLHEPVLPERRGRVVHVPQRPQTRLRRVRQQQHAAHRQPGVLQPAADAGERGRTLARLLLGVHPVVRGGLRRYRPRPRRDRPQTGSRQLVGLRGHHSSVGGGGARSPSLLGSALGPVSSPRGPT